MSYTPEQISQIVLKVLKEIETPDVLSLSWEEKVKLAQDPNTTPETLSILATDKDPGFRQLVADHPNTTPETLSVLATDKDPAVRRWVAQHPNWWVAQHPNYKPKTLELTPEQYDALKQLIESGQNESLKGLLDT